MDDIETQKLWIQLQQRKAAAEEDCARSIADGDRGAYSRHSSALNEISLALLHLRSAKSIRELLAKIEAIGDLHAGS